MEFTKEQLNEIRKTGIFDFVTNNAHKLDKDEIVYLFKEYSHAVYTIDKSVEQRAMEYMIDEFEL